MSMVPGAVGTGSTFPDGITGSVTGSTAGSGHTGEVQTFTYSGGTVTTTTADTTIDVQSISVPAGVWLLVASYTGTLHSTASLGTGTGISGAVYLTDNSNTVLERSAIQMIQTTAAANFWRTHHTLVYPIAVSGTTTYKIRITCSESTANGDFSLANDASTGLSGTTQRVANTKLLRIA